MARHPAKPRAPPVARSSDHRFALGSHTPKGYIVGALVNARVSLCSAPSPGHVSNSCGLKVSPLEPLQFFSGQASAQDMHAYPDRVQERSKKVENQESAIPTILQPAMLPDRSSQLSLEASHEWQRNCRCHFRAASRILYPKAFPAWGPCELASGRPIRLSGRWSPQSQSLKRTAEKSYQDARGDAASIN
jgi:hypothetical protein